MTDELMHYGILGMRWGIRRYQNPDGSLTSAGKKRYQEMDRKTAPKTSKIHQRGTPYTKEELMSFKSASQVWAHRDEYTDQELNQVMNRIQSEQRLATMAASENQKKISIGQKFVNNIIAPAARSTAQAAVTGAMKYSAKKLVASKNAELAAAMFGGSPEKKKEEK